MLAFNVGPLLDVWNLKSRMLFRKFCKVLFEHFWFISKHRLLTADLDDIPECFDTAKTLTIDTHWGFVEELSLPQKKVIVRLTAYQDAEIRAVVVSDVNSLADKKVLPLPKYGHRSLSDDGKYVSNMLMGYVRVWRVPL
jgi:hypothetical protein